jgi:hypothetical protein
MATNDTVDGNQEADKPKWIDRYSSGKNLLPIDGALEVGSVEHAAKSMKQLTDEYESLCCRIVDFERKLDDDDGYEDGHQDHMYDSLLSEEEVDRRLVKLSAALGEDAPLDLREFYLSAGGMIEEDSTNDVLINSLNKVVREISDGNLEGRIEYNKSWLESSGVEVQKMFPIGQDGGSERWVCR